MRLRAAALLLALTAPGPALASTTATAASKHTRVMLAPGVASIQPGRPFWVGLRLQLDKNWHTYWKNPGDSGLPTRIRWTLPAGFEASAIHWPLPRRFLTDPLMSYGYADEVWLLTEIRPPVLGAKGEVAIAARVDWLECEDVCLPGQAQLGFALPVTAAAPAPAMHGAAIERSRGLVPAKPGFEAKATAQAQSLRLAVLGAARPRQAYFFPAQAGVIEHALPQKLETAGAGFVLFLPRAANGKPAQALSGVLELDGRAFEIEAPMDAALARTGSR